jgi:hypothetical protein
VTRETRSIRASARESKLCFHPVLACRDAAAFSPLSFLSSLLDFLFMLREIFDGYGLRHICFAAAPETKPFLLPDVDLLTPHKRQPQEPPIDRPPPSCLHFPTLEVHFLLAHCGS